MSRNPATDNLFASFAHSASLRPGKPAVFWAEHEVSYGQVLAQACWVAGELRERFGVRPGDRVALWLRNRPEFISALFGILAVGAVAVPVNCFLKSAEVGYLLADAGVTAVISEAALDSLLAELGDQPAVRRLLRVEEFPADLVPVTTLAPALAVAAPAVPADLAVLIYTSGTTGRPKGAMLTHGNLLHNVDSCRQILEVADFDRFVLLLPMFHSFMLTVCVLLPMTVGGTIVLVKSLNQPKQVVAEILHRQGTVLPGMAALFRTLAQLPAGLELPLRLCVSGAGPLPREILRAFNERHPAIPLIEGYGLSEASPVVSVNPIKGPWIAGTIGLPVPGVEVSVQDDAGVALPDGETGELCVRGGNVMVGYWNAPEKTAETLVNGWLRTGDIGHRRPDGFFVVTDRKKDMLKPNGINVYPREIEEVIQCFPGVRETAVVGEPCERRGERPVAFVSTDAGVVDERALLAFLRERLADYKLPKRIVLITEWPRTGTGKIMKPVLREMVANRTPVV